jgi:hypothetical protein
VSDSVHLFLVLGLLVFCYLYCPVSPFFIVITSLKHAALVLLLCVLSVFARVFPPKNNQDED